MSPALMFSPAICREGGGGVVLPLWGDAEHLWPDGLRAVLYSLGMIYSFLGVAIIADMFVASIETVTSKKRQRKLKSDKLVTERVWNDTVATLSLMALGSSAPEIALSVVDLFKKRFYFAPLGAQTIAGSAAFNLLVIVAVCISVIPSTETRQIAELPAFYVTAAVSVLAYLWLVFILVIHTKDVVDIWEAVATFLYLPMLIWISYKVDVGDAQRLLVKLGCLRDESSEEEADAAKEANCLAFPAETMSVEAGPAPQEIEVLVRRPVGATGVVSFSCRTERLNAVPDFDYTELLEHRLEFAEDVAEERIKLEILPKRANRATRKFLLVMEGVMGNAQLDSETDGGKDATLMTVTITAPGSDSGSAYWLDSLVNFNEIHAGNSAWAEQIRSSFFCLGSPELQKEATSWEWFSHITSLPWKLLLSLVPPTNYLGGWVCFFASLLVIGGLTVVISDLAELFGCVLGVRDDVTALTFVALGTSMPDLFASISAAREDATADASIVNVTGSNSVNVFLGLGLPWTIGAIYWALTGRTDEWAARYPQEAQRQPAGQAVFVVESRNLGFCVIIFTVACIVALGLLFLRRGNLGAELGGPFVPKAVSTVSFILFWLGFVVVASWRVMRWNVAEPFEVWGVVAGVGSIELFVAIGAMATISLYHARLKAKEANLDFQTPAGEITARGPLHRSGSMRSESSAWDSSTSKASASSEQSSMEEPPDERPGPEEPNAEPRARVPRRGHHRGAYRRQRIAKASEHGEHLPGSRSASSVASKPKLVLLPRLM